MNGSVPSKAGVVVLCRPAPGDEDAISAACAGLIKSMRFCHAVLGDERRGEHQNRVDYALRNLTRHRTEVAQEIVATVERIQDGERNLDGRGSLVLGPAGVEVAGPDSIRVADGSGYAELRPMADQPRATELGAGLRRVTPMASGVYRVEACGPYLPPKHLRLIAAAVAQVNADRAGVPGPFSEDVAEAPRHRHVCEVRCRSAWPAPVHWARHEGDDGVDYSYRCDPRCFEEENCTQEEIRHSLRLMRIPLCSECSAPLRATGLDDDLEPLGWVCDTPDHLCSVGGQKQRVEPGLWGFEPQGS